MQICVHHFCAKYKNKWNWKRSEFLFFKFTLLIVVLVLVYLHSTLSMPTQGRIEHRNDHLWRYFHKLTPKSEPFKREINGCKTHLTKEELVGSDPSYIWPSLAQSSTGSLEEWVDTQTLKAADFYGRAKVFLFWLFVRAFIGTGANTFLANLLIVELSWYLVCCFSLTIGELTTENVKLQMLVVKIIIIFVSLLLMNDVYK